MKVNSTWKRSSKFFFLPPLFVFLPEISFVKMRGRIFSITLSPVKPLYLLFHVIHRSCRSPASTSITRASLLLILFLLFFFPLHSYTSLFSFSYMVLLPLLFITKQKSAGASAVSWEDWWTYEGISGEPINLIDFLIFYSIHAFYSNCA